MRRFGAVLAVLLVAACSSGNGGGPKGVGHADQPVPSTPSALALALASGGLTCTSYATVDDPAGPFDHWDSQGSCDHDGKSLSLSIYKDSRHVHADLAAADGVGCTMGQAFGITEFNIAYGDNWAVTYADDLDRDVPQQAADILGGQFHHHEC